MPVSTKDRVKKHRGKMMQAGFRAVHLWVPDTRKKGFSEELKRQALLVATSDKEDKELDNLLDNAFQEVGGQW